MKTDRDWSDEKERLIEHETCLSTEGNSTRRPSSKAQVTFYTVEDAIESMGFGIFQVIVATFCGLLWMADAMELMILAVLSPALECEWGTSKEQEALVTTVVFIGFLVGGLMWGSICDVFGRKFGLFFSDFTILVCGVLSAIPVSGSMEVGYPWLLVARFGVGFGAGGVPQAVTYYTEFLPKKMRGVCIISQAVFWCIGSIFGALLAMAVIPSLSWHWYLGLAAIPAALVLFLFPLVPESARYYLVKGKIEKAEKTIRRIAWYNRKVPPVGQLITVEEKELRLKERERDELKAEEQEEQVSVHEELKEKAPLIHVDEAEEVYADFEMGFCAKVKKQLLLFTTLFTNGMWKTSGILLVLWFEAAWLYYGCVLLTTTIIQYEPHCGIDTTNNTNSCTPLDTTEYLQISGTAAAELPGIILTLVAVELIGRKWTFAMLYFGCAVGYGLLFICVPNIALTAFLFLIRAFSTGVFQTAYLYTPEVFPTNVRAVAMSVFVAAARVGAIVTPYVAQRKLLSYGELTVVGEALHVLLHTSDWATIGLYAGSALIMVLFSLLLPIETKGRSLMDGQ